MTATDQYLATGVKRFFFFTRFKAWLIIDVHLAMDNFSTSLAFNRKW
jgi:hypothetical protein